MGLRGYMLECARKKWLPGYRRSTPEADVRICRLPRAAIPHAALQVFHQHRIHSVELAQKRLGRHSAFPREPGILLNLGARLRAHAGRVWERGFRTSLRKNKTSP